jgi:hypothetical protein
MKSKAVLYVLTVIVLSIIGALSLPLSEMAKAGPPAQGDATEQQQTIDAVVYLYFTQTAQAKHLDITQTVEAPPVQTLRAMYATATAFQHVILMTRTALQPIPTLTPTPPPLKSDAYLHDNSLISQDSCGPLCFRGITINETTYFDAVTKIKADPLFSNVQIQYNPLQAAWSTKDGVGCCQLTSDQTTGLVNYIVVRTAPIMSLGDVIAKYGEPPYTSVSTDDYSPDEVALGLVYPKTGNVIWIMPGNVNSNVTASSPVVMVSYFDPRSFDGLLVTATLEGWLGYKPYRVYKAAPPVLTPRVTLTPMN